jgi:hypothetical protein
MTHQQPEGQDTSLAPGASSDVGQDGAGPPQGGPGQGLVGRDEELGALWGFLRRVDIGGGALLVSGEPGVGKSALLEAAAAHAYDLGLNVVRAAGAEFEVEVSFASLNQLLGPFLGLMPQLDPADWEALGAAVQLGRGRTGDPTLVSTATLALLRTAAEHQPVLLVVDDLPWLDKASARVLAFVARRLAGSPIGFLGAARVGEAGLFDDVDLPRLRVAPLPCWIRPSPTWGAGSVTASSTTPGATRWRC